MVFKFVLCSDEVDDFVREIQIDSEATFLDFQNAILDSVGYTKDQMTSFFICSDSWEKGQEITLVEMETSSEYDSYVMEDTKVEEFVSDEGQRLIFVFDNMCDRCFFIEMQGISSGSLEQPVCTRSEGKAPVQIEDMFGSDLGVVANDKDAFGFDEDFLESYNDDELDNLSLNDDSYFEDQGY